MEQLRPGDPSRVGNYRLIGRLGEGGMGQVFLGLSPGGRQVAVKVIHPGYASGRQFRERFAREIDAARRVGGYYTASVVDADPTADAPWMVTAFIPGPSLQQAVAEGGSFSLERVCQLGAGLAEGLAAIHACGLVHRDLKPSNVILASDGPRIIDFGISRAAEDSPMTTAGMVVGTYSYMSPEQLRGEVAGPGSDVFALGCTLAFAATGRITFGDDSIVTVMYRITTEQPDLSGVPVARGFQQLISECLAKNAADRPSLAAIMERLAEADSYGAATPPELAETIRPGSLDRGSGPGASGAPGAGGSAAAGGAPGAGGPPAGGGAGAGDAVRPGGVGSGADVGSGVAASAGPGPGSAGQPGSAPGAGGGGWPASDAGARGAAAAAGLAGLSGAPGAGSGAGPGGGPGPGLRGSGAAGRPGGLYEPTQTVRNSDDTAPGSGRDANLHTDDQMTRRDQPPPGPNGPQAQQPVWPSAQPPQAGAPGRSRVPRRGLLIGAGAAVVVVGVVAGLLLSHGNTPTHEAAVQSSAPASGHPSASPSTSVSAAVPTLPQLSLHDPSGKNVFGDVFSSEGVLATGDSNGSSYLWNTATGKLTGTLSDPSSNGINGIAFSSATSTYAMADANGNIYLWSTSGKLTATLSNGSRDNDRIAISPDGSRVAVGSSGGSAYLWDVAGGSPKSQPASSVHDPGGKNVYGVAFSPSGSLLATGDTNGNTYLWNVATGQLTATLTDPASKGLYDIAFSPDGNLLAVTDVSSSTGDGVVYVWNVATHKLAATLQSFYNSEFADIAFTPDSRFLAAGDTIGKVSFWNVSTGKYLNTLSDPVGKSIIGVAFSPSGDLLASTDTAGDAYLWNTKFLGS